MSGPDPFRVALDGRMASHSGIGRYVRGLVRELPRLRASLEWLLLVPPRFDAGGLETAPFDAPLYSFREQAVGRQLVRRHAREVSLFHFPHYNAPLDLPRASVVTVHDLTHLERPDLGRGRVLAARMLLGAVVRGAGAILTVSQATRAALEARFPRARGKTTVVHPGVDDVFRPPSERNVAGDYFLFVGIDRRHKNLQLALSAFGTLRREQPAIGLVVVTDRPPAGEVPPGVRYLSGISDTELAWWYGAATALLLPSRSEGFGLPAVEALACGTPVLASDIPALREVVGDAGWFLDPEDETAWRAAMRALLDDPARRAALAERAVPRAGRFRWDVAAERTLAVYDRVARRR